MVSNDSEKSNLFIENSREFVFSLIEVRIIIDEERITSQGKNRWKYS